jgi:hypothetical protein
VREEFADRYPSIKPGEWHDASWVREKVLEQQRRISPRQVLAGRVLDDAHFEFQGVGAHRSGAPEHRMHWSDVLRGHDMP